MKQKMMGWQWHQLDHMQIICTLLQTDNHASTLTLIFMSQMLFMSLCQSAEGKVILWNEWRKKTDGLWLRFSWQMDIKTSCSDWTSYKHTSLSCLACTTVCV